jgi:hypothetical protein
MFDIREMERIIFSDAEKLTFVFSRRNNEFLQDFKMFTEILNTEKIRSIPWKAYTVFKNAKSLLTAEESEVIREEITQIHKIFGDISLEEIESNIDMFLHEGSVAGLINCEADIEKYLFGLDVFPSKLIEILIRLLMDKNFLDADGSWHILKILHHECEKVSSHQWEHLLPKIENSFSRFKDWMSCFILTELIGEDFPTMESFYVVVRLRNTSNEICRSYIPNALEGFIRNSNDLKIRREAYNNLVDMMNDKSTIVAKESLKSYKSVQEIVEELF